MAQKKTVVRNSFLAVLGSIAAAGAVYILGLVAFNSLFCTSDWGGFGGAMVCGLILRFAMPLFYGLVFLGVLITPNKYKTRNFIEVASFTVLSGFIVDVFRDLLITKYGFIQYFLHSLLILLLAYAIFSLIFRLSRISAYVVSIIVVLMLAVTLGRLRPIVQEQQTLNSLQSIAYYYLPKGQTGPISLVSTHVEPNVEGDGVRLNFSPEMTGILMGTEFSQSNCFQASRFIQGETHCKDPITTPSGRKIMLLSSYKGSQLISYYIGLPRGSMALKYVPENITQSDIEMFVDSFVPVDYGEFIQAGQK